MTRLAEFAAPLRSRAFRMLWLGQLVSALGDRLVEIGILFAVLALHHRASDVALVLAAGIVPRCALTLAGGVWGDRLPRRWIMIWSDLTRAAAQATTAALLFTGTAQLWQLVALTAVHGAAAAFFGPASTGLTPETVSAPLRMRANALMNLSRNGVSIAVPALGGVLFVLLGAGWLFALDSASFLVSVACLLLLRVPPRTVEAEHFFAELRQGWVEVVSRPWLRSSLVYFALWNLSVAPTFVLGPYVAQQSLGGSVAWGWIMSGGAAGSVLGSMIALRVSTSRPLATAYVALLVAFVPGAALAIPLTTPVILVAMLVMTGTMSWANTVWETTLQDHVPPGALSRVSAYDWLLSFTSLPLGFALAGAIAGPLGTSRTLWLGAGVMTLFTIGILAVPDVRHLRRVVHPAAFPEITSTGK